MLSLCNNLLYEEKHINHQVSPYAIFFTRQLINLSQVKLLYLALYYQAYNLLQLLQ